MLNISSFFNVKKKNNIFPKFINGWYGLTGLYYIA